MLFLEIKKWRCLTDGNLLSFFVPVIFGLSAIYVSSFLFLKSESNKKLKDASEKISVLLADSFNQAHQIIYRTGKAITYHNSLTPEVIENLIGRNREDWNKIDASSSWLDIGWINTKKEFVYDWNHGAPTAPIDCSNRFSFQTLDHEPWKMVLSKARVGFLTGLREIPGAMAVANDKGETLGYICVGFIIADLNNKIRAILPSDYIDYTVLDKKFSIVLQSDSSHLDTESTFFRDVLDETNVLFSNDGFFEKPVSVKDISYSHFKKIRQFHMTVLVGENRAKFYASVFKYAFVPAGLFFILCLFLFTSYNLFREYFFQNLRKADKERGNFLNHIAHFMKQPLEEVILTSEILNRFHKGDIDLGITEGRQAVLIDKIHSAALNLDTFVQTDETKAAFDINKTIEECILIQFQSAVLKKLKITKNLSRNLPPFYANHLRFQQIVVGLLALSFEYCRERSRVVIETSLKIEGEQTSLILSALDDGLFLDEEHLRRLGEIFKKSGPKTFTDPLGVNFPILEKLVHLESGSIHLEPGPNSKWKKIVISLPLCSDKVQTQKDEILETNLIPFKKGVVDS